MVGAGHDRLGYLEKGSASVSLRGAGGLVGALQSVSRHVKTGSQPSTFSESVLPDTFAELVFEGLEIRGRWEPRPCTGLSARSFLGLSTSHRDS